MIYWTNEDSINIKKYLNSNDVNEKNRLLSLLYPSIKTNAEQVYFKFNRRIDLDEVTDLITFIYTKVLPKIKQEKILATQQLIWVSLNRKAINNFNQKNRIKNKENIQFFDNMNVFDNDNNEDLIEFDNDLQIELERKKKQKEILNKIDSMIEQQKVLNKTNSIFLILLKDYLIENNFNSNGFREYVIERMELNKRKFWNICSTLGIRSTIFNSEDSIDKRKVMRKQSN